MARLSSLLDRVHDEMPAVPKQLAMRALSDATKEFCTRTHAWQERLDDIALTTGVVAYELSLGSGIQLAALKDVRVDGVKLHAFATESVRLVHKALPAGNPQGYVQWAPTAIQLVNASDLARTMTLEAALTLRLGATEVDVPDDLIDEYGEYIASGAKGRLARMAGQPWHSPDATIGYMTLYYGAVNQAKGRAMTALGDADVQVAMRSW